MFVFQFNHLDIAVVAMSLLLVLLNFNSAFKTLLKEVLFNSNTTALVVVMVATAITMFINGHWVGGLWIVLFGPVAIYETIDPPMGQQ